MTCKTPSLNRIVRLQGFRVRGITITVQGSGFRVQGLELTVHGIV
jgi:hypothetical protein